MHILIHNIDRAKTGD